MLCFFKVVFLYMNYCSDRMFSKQMITIRLFANDILIVFLYKKTTSVSTASYYRHHHHLSTWHESWQHDRHAAGHNLGIFALAWALPAPNPPPRGREERGDGRGEGQEGGTGRQGKDGTGTTLWLGSETLGPAFTGVAGGVFRHICKCVGDATDGPLACFS